jgi:hypothetical protein
VLPTTTRVLTQLPPQAFQPTRGSPLSIELALMSAVSRSTAAFICAQPAGQPHGAVAQAVRLSSAFSEPPEASFLTASTESARLRAAGLSTNDLLDYAKTLHEANVLSVAGLGVSIWTDPDVEWMDGLMHRAVRPLPLAAQNSSSAAPK